MPGEMPEYFDNIVLGQYAMTGVPLKVYANSRYYIIPSPEDVDDPLIGYGMTPAGKMEPFDYRDIQHIMVSGNKVDISTYVKALGDELKGVKKASDAKGGEEKKEGGEEEKPAEGGEGGEEAKASPFESFDPYAKKWSLKALYEISKEEHKAQEDALKAEMEAGKAKIAAAKDKMSDLKKQPIDDSVIKEDSMKGTYAGRDVIINKRGTDMTKWTVTFIKSKKTVPFVDAIANLKDDKGRRFIQQLGESVISDILIIAMESTTYDKFISELIKQKLLKREDLRDPDLVDELKTMYRGQALGKRESVNELKLTSAGVKELLAAIYYNWDKLRGVMKRERHFNSFKAIVAYLKSGDQEEQQSLEKFVRAQGIKIGTLESAHVNESDYQIRPALKKLKTGLKDDDVVFTIDDEKLDQMVNSKFGSRLDIEEVNGDSYYILNQRDFDRLVDLADSRGFDVDYENSEDSVLSIYENVNENHISEPYMFQVGDLVRNVNPQCKHYGSVGIVNSIQALDNDMGDIIKYIVTNYGDTFKPGMALMKTPNQLEFIDNHEDWDEHDHHDMRDNF